MDKAQNRLPHRIWPFIFYVLRALPFRVRFFTFCTVTFKTIVVVIDTYMMYGFKLLVDGISSAPEGDLWTAVAKPFWIISSCCVGHIIFYRVRSVMDARSTPQTQNGFREVLLDYLTHHNQEYFNDRFSGSLVNKINNIVRGYERLLVDVIQFGFLEVAAVVLTASWLLWSVSPWIVAILWFVTLLLIVTGLAFSPWISRVSAEQAERESDITGQIVDAVGNISSVTNYAQNKHELNILRSVQGPFVRSYQQLTWAYIIFWTVFDLIITGMFLGFIVQMISSWHTRHLTAGDVTMCVGVAWDLWWRFGSMASTLSQLSSEKGRMQEALDEIVQIHEIVDHPEAKVLTVPKGEIVFQNVNFMYRSGHRVFSNLNLRIQPSQRVGLVGLSGAGKTTLCQLLLRHYEIQAGRIFIDGQDITSVTQESLRRSIAVIPQDTSLFHRSLKENIAYGSPEATDAAIIAAAKAAEAHNFIVATPQGYDTMVGERGVKLSGGQRQRIAIARAILKDGPILVLDEATSALDSQTERSIQKALYTAMEGRTTLVIAHRLSTLAHLDRLVVLRDGQIVEDGTLEELLDKKGYFADLWRLQADGFLPEKMAI